MKVREALEDHARHHLEASDCQGSRPGQLWKPAGGLRERIAPRNHPFRLRFLKNRLRKDRCDDSRIRFQGREADTFIFRSGQGAVDWEVSRDNRLVHGQLEGHSRYWENPRRRYFRPGKDLPGS